MKKAILFFIVILLISPIFALIPECGRSEKFKIKAVPINEYGFIFDSNTKGTIEFIKGDKMRAIANGLLPYTYYTLVYLGSIENNETIFSPICIRSRKTTKNGGVKFNLADFDYSCMLKDNKEDLFAIIKSSDINCVDKSLLNYNPEKYLFSTRLI
ncbi:MAG: hypothetical protein QXW97_04500 [Candidatus Pacearchaeota archaeon]